MAEAKNSVFVFKVALKYQKRIWRKIAIRGDQSLATLHDAIVTTVEIQGSAKIDFPWSMRAI